MKTLSRILAYCVLAYGTAAVTTKLIHDYAAAPTRSLDTTERIDADLRAGSSLCGLTAGAAIGGLATLYEANRRLSEDRR